METEEIEKEFIVSGNVQGVGYRGYVTKIARKFKFDGKAENLEDGTVRIHCKGNVNDIEIFKNKIKEKPKTGPILIDVEDIIEHILDPGTITEKGFKEKYDEKDVAKEMVQGNETGMNYLNLFREQTDDNFKLLDNKYHIISTSLEKIIGEWKEERKFTEKRFEQTQKNSDERFEKIQKNIERLIEMQK